MNKRLPSTPRCSIDIDLETIFEAEQRDSSHCMIADAIKKQMPEASYVSVDLQTIRWTDSAKGLRYIYLTPRVAQVALVKFDQGMHTEPFSFQLRNGQTTKTGRKQDPAQIVGAKGRPGSRGGSVPGINGGKAPPLASLSNSVRVRGSRRAYGLRGLEL